MPTDTDDEVWNRAESRYSAKLVHRSRLKKSTAFVENLALSALSGFPELVVSSQDKVVVVDSRTNRIVLSRGGTDVPASDLLNELAVDLQSLSIRQFRTKWCIED
jgi:hypothetical protein